MASPKSDLDAAQVCLEDVIEKTLYALEVKPEWAGRYVSLTPGHINQISDSEYRQLVEDGLMFPPAHTDPMLVAAGLAADWPCGRGDYISADEKTVVHIGYIDHIAGAFPYNRYCAHTNCR